MFDDVIEYLKHVLTLVLFKFGVAKGFGFGKIAAFGAAGGAGGGFGKKGGLVKGKLHMYFMI